MTIVSQIKKYHRNSSLEFIIFMTWLIMFWVVDREYLDVRNHVWVFFTECWWKLASAVIMGLKSLTTADWQRVAQLGPELRLAPLQDDGGAEEAADGWVGQSRVLCSQQDENQFGMLILSWLIQFWLEIWLDPLCSQIIIWKHNDCFPGTLHNLSNLVSSLCGVMWSTREVPVLKTNSVLITSFQLFAENCLDKCRIQRTVGHKCVK